jgi:3-deoxy-D-manno-octulosonic-acid transferase
MPLLTLYRVLGYLLLPFVLPLLLLHPKLRGRLGERFGRCPVPGTRRPRIWVHAASAGDVKAVYPLLLALRRELPGAAIVLAVATRTGLAMADSLRVPVEHAFFAPLDIAHACTRAARRIRPDLLLLEYAELWPNLVTAARRAGARVVLTNGRVSPRGFGRARLVRGLYGRLLAEVDLCLMRSAGDAERIEALGASRSRIAVTGNTKYDVPAPSSADVAKLGQALGLRPGARLLVLGNTHSGEEALLLPVYRRLRADFSDLRCLVAPRYPERCVEVEAICARLGLESALRSAGPSPAPVLLLDTVGELAAAYGLGTAAFVGGSFTSRGGQNVLEPALHGVPTLYGPNTVNFREEVALLSGRGGIEVADVEEFEGEVRALFEDSARREALSRSAARTVAELRGASEENARRIAELLR